MAPAFRLKSVGIRSLVAIAVSLIVTMNARTADPPPPKPPSYSVEGMDDYVPALSKFIDLIAKGEIDKAYDSFRVPDAQPKDAEELKAFEEIKTQLMVLKEKGGSYRGCEATGVKPITSRLHKVYVVAAFDAKPVLFSFVMYKPAKEWQCRDFDFGTTINDFVESYPMVTNLRK